MTKKNTVTQKHHVKALYGDWNELKQKLRLSVLPLMRKIRQPKMYRKEVADIIIIIIIMPPPPYGGSNAFVWRLSVSLSDNCTRTSGLTREQRGLGRLKLAQR